MRQTISMAGLCLALALSGCATGYGEAATGSLVVSIVPEGDASGEFHFEEAALTIHEFVAHAAEVEEEDDDGDDHHHHHLESEGASTSAPDEERATFGVGATAPISIDLLGPGRELGPVIVSAASYEGIALIPAPADAGSAEGCTFFARGKVPLAPNGDPVAVRICLPSVDILEVHAHFDVALDKETTVELHLEVEDLLQGVEPSLLEPEDDGSIAIDGSHNRAAAATIQANLAGALSAEDDHDHDH